MKKIEDRLEALKQDYQNIPIPADGRERLQKAMEQAKEESMMNERNKMNEAEKKTVNRPVFLRRLGGIAAAVLILAALPNTSAQMARATGSLPVVGPFFRAVTVRTYTYDEDGASAKVEVPEVKTNVDSSAVEQVNQDVAKYVDGLTEEFKTRVAEAGAEANTDLTVSYEVVTDNENWLTLRLYTEVVQASGAQYSRYYNIDKKQDKVVQLADLFAADSNGLSLISEDIKRQMREKMAADDSVSYFLDSEIPDDDFKQVKDDQNFRFDDDGNLVICFDEYEVAPGSMGLVEFTVARSVFENALAQR